MLTMSDGTEDRDDGPETVFEAFGHYEHCAKWFRGDAASILHDEVACTCFSVKPTARCHGWYEDADTYRETIWRRCGQNVGHLGVCSKRAEGTGPSCVNCGHSDPHNGPAGSTDDACTFPGCNCGFFQEPGLVLRADESGAGEKRRRHAHWDRRSNVSEDKRPSVQAVFEITKWSTVPGDIAYVEASDVLAARSTLVEWLSVEGHALDIPEEEWHVSPAPRPFFRVVWKD
jgi:hypothetical protein